MWLRELINFCSCFCIAVSVVGLLSFVLSRVFALIFARVLQCEATVIKRNLRELNSRKFDVSLGQDCPDGLKWKLVKEQMLHMLTISCSLFRHTCSFVTVFVQQKFELCVHKEKYK